MSIKARSIWDFLHKKKMATPTFSKLLWDMWDLYACAMLTDPQFNFLLLCDDATWKLCEWSTQNYPGWAGNQGLQMKNPNQDMSKNKDALDNPTLIMMKSSDGTNDSNDTIPPSNHAEDDSNRIMETTPDPKDAGLLEAVNEPGESPGPSTQLVCGIIILLGDTNTTSKPQGHVISEENPGPLTQLVHHVLHIFNDANTHPKPQGPIQLVIADPFTPTTPNSPLGSHTGVTRINPSPTTSATSAPVQGHAVMSDICKEASAVVTTEAHPGSDVPS
ncbi:hypothetical protein EDB87DRAFT_1580408 [Lactarius vividus]|nr:hypothetical protein EDB87DRAFT_1580408 [Lactarius vividus]